MLKINMNNNVIIKKKTNWSAYFYNTWFLYLMLVPVIIYFVVFKYMPMYGVLIAWKDYSPVDGIWGSEWVGFKHFKLFFSGMYFTRVLKNTLLLNGYLILFGFPIPIVFALLLNELKDGFYKRTIQTVSYLPHFISTVIVCGMLYDFLSEEGMITSLLTIFGLERKNWLMQASAYRSIYVFSEIWKTMGWGAIIYLASLGNIDSSLYHAAEIDGCGTIKKMIHVTLPGIMPTIIILFILRMGSIISVGPEKTLLLYSPKIYEVSDVISTYVYRTGLLNNRPEYSTAVDLFNSLINLCFLIATNAFARKKSEMSLW